MPIHAHVIGAQSSTRMIFYIIIIRYLPTYAAVRAVYWIIIDAAGDRDLLTATAVVDRWYTMV